VKGSANVPSGDKAVSGRTIRVLGKVGFYTRIKDELVRFEINAAYKATLEEGISERLIKILRKSVSTR
jgi:hypothetical protein